MMIQSLALLTLLSVNALAGDVPFANLRNHGQEYTGFEYRVNTVTGEGFALLGFRELVDRPGPCPGGNCMPIWYHRVTSVSARVPGLRFDAAAQRIVHTDAATLVSTVCATTEQRIRRGRTVLYIHPTGDCHVSALRSRRWFEFFFEGK